MNVRIFTQNKLYLVDIYGLVLATAFRHQFVINQMIVGFLGINADIHINEYL